MNSRLKVANTPVLVSRSRLREWTPNLFEGFLKAFEGPSAETGMRTLQIEKPFRDPFRNHSEVGIPIAWYKARIPVCCENRQGKEQVVFSGRGWRGPKISLALEQPRLAPVHPWGCSGARDNFGTLRPSPEKTTCSFPHRFSGKTRNSGLVPGNRNPNFRHFLGFGGCVAGNESLDSNSLTAVLVL